MLFQTKTKYNNICNGFKVRQTDFGARIVLTALPMFGKVERGRFLMGTESAADRERPVRMTLFQGLLFSAAVAFISCSAFHGALHYGFVYDDFELVVRNPDIRDLSAEGFKELFLDRDYVNFLPLRMISYAVDYHFSGLDPYVYHLTNLIFHTMNCLLVFFIVFYMLH